ncbi:MAG: energy transducer TonB [Cyclobacteriaceae bacterium]|nr:energy transducer TonB [Cyclobacteriaceae bacterium]
MDDWKDDIEKYKRGELTPNEMHSLEKKALSDPFLADALEGADTISAKDFSEDLNELKKSIQYQTEQKSVVSFGQAEMASTAAPKQASKEQAIVGDVKSPNKWVWPLRIAASLFIILGIFWAANQLIPNEEKESLALKKEVDTKREKPPLSQEASDSIDVVQQPIASTPSKLFVEKPKQIAGTQSIENVAKGLEPAAAAEGERQTALMGRPEDKKAAQELREEKESIVTELAKAENVASAQSIAPIDLEPDLAQLSEVVVTGAAARDDSQTPPVVRLAEPAGGRKAYDKYLENSLRYPVEAVTKKIKGRVTVKFTVRTDGTLDEFSVVKSLGYGCDEEVVRLVKEGPSWSPTFEDNVPVESEVLVKVRFDPSKARQ